MGTQAISPYQQVIEKTKGLAFRSQMLVMNIEKRLGAKEKEVRLIYYFQKLYLKFKSCHCFYYVFLVHDTVVSGPYTRFICIYTV